MFASSIKTSFSTYSLAYSLSIIPQWEEICWRTTGLPRCCYLLIDNLHFNISQEEEAFHWFYWVESCLWITQNDNICKFDKETQKLLQRNINCNNLMVMGCSSCTLIDMKAKKFTWFSTTSIRLIRQKGSTSKNFQLNRFRVKGYSLFP